MADCKTAGEFNPDYFKAIFGDVPEDWSGFIAVTLRTYKEGFGKLKQAVSDGDMDVISEVRHALGPSLVQWGAVSLEKALLALDAGNLTSQWPPLEPEFAALLRALEQQ